MARYRVGNKYLSQEEYNEEQDSKLKFWLFLIGAAVSGFLIHKYVVNLEWHNFIRFLVTIAPSVTVGYLLARFRQFVIMTIGAVVGLLVIAIVISILYEFV